MREFVTARSTCTILLLNATVECQNDFPNSCASGLHTSTYTCFSTQELHWCNNQDLDVGYSKEVSTFQSKQGNENEPSGTSGWDWHLGFPETVCLWKRMRYEVPSPDQDIHLRGREISHLQSVYVLTRYVLTRVPSTISNAAVVLRVI